MACNARSRARWQSGRLSGVSREMLLTDLRCSDAAAIPLLRIDQIYPRYHNDDK